MTGSDNLERLLRGYWRDPESGALLPAPGMTVVIEASLSGREGEVIAALDLGQRIAVVSDPTTREVLAQRVESAVSQQSGTPLPIVLNAQPHADEKTVDMLRSASDAADALIAVGSGTINDLCKYVAAKDGKPYAVFATAPSMNGYASKNAAITVDGHKHTLPAAPPVGVFMDLAVLCAAPARMIRAGIGDSLCRSTAQADWLLSHHVLETPFRAAPFALLADDEPGWMDEPEALFQGDVNAMRALARTLILSGLGMTICNGSYPASQGEHLISHYIDMFAPPSRDTYLHGEQVAVATLTMARIQQEVLSAGPPHLHPPSTSSDELQQLFGPEIGAACWNEFQNKRLTLETRRAFEELVTERWARLDHEVRQTMLPVERIEEVLKRAGCPTTPEQIGIFPEFYASAVRNARFLRDRYTFLDLADDAGLLATMYPHDWRSAHSPS